MSSGVGNVLKMALPAIAAVAVPELAPALAGYGGMIGAGTGALEGLASGGGLRGAVTGGLSGYGAGSLGQGLGTFGSALSGGAGFNDALIQGFPIIGSAENGFSNLTSGGSGLGSLLGGGSSNAGDIVWDTPAMDSLTSSVYPNAAAAADGLLNNPVSSGSNALDNAAAMTAAKYAGGPSSTLNSFLSTGATMAGAGGSPMSSGGAGGGGTSAFSGLGLGGLLSGASGIMNSMAINKATNQMAGQNQLTQQELAPYAATGQQANKSLGALLNPGTDLSYLQSTPGYQFNLQQGQQALNNQLAASGMTGSGAALKAAEQFGQGLADTTYQQVLQNAMGGANMGMNAVSGQGALNSNLGSLLAGNTLGQANNMNKTLGLLAGRPIIGYMNGQPIYA